ncbi:MAG: hypothetical protein ABIS26_02120 [Candidatus Paceibacterota bacterium]
MNEGLNSNTRPEKKEAEEQGAMMRVYLERFKGYKDGMKGWETKTGPSNEEYEEASKFIDELIKNAEDESTADKIGYAVARAAYLPPATLLLISIVLSGGLGSGLAIHGLQDGRRNLSDARERLNLFKKEARKTAK